MGVTLGARVIGRRRLASWSAVGLAAALVVAACGPAQTGGGSAAPDAAGATDGPVRGGTIIFGNAKELANAHPYIATSSVSNYIKEMQYEGLLAYDHESKLQPHLAESYTGAEQGKVWTFKLRKGVRFQDGSEMTAEDVVWSANYVRDPANGAFGKAGLENVENVEALDDRTVRFTLGAASAVFPNALAGIRTLGIVPKDSLRIGALKVEGDPPPGTGPFKLEKWVPGTETSYVRFDDYWDGAAYVDRIVFKLIADDNARLNALRAGDIQIAERIPVEGARRIDGGEIEGLKHQPARLSGFRRVVFNHKSPLFKDRTMREAVAHAIDAPRILQEIYFGYGAVTKLKLPPGSAWEKAAALPDRERDVAKAKELLAAAGYKGEQVVGIGRRGEHNALWEALSLQLQEAGINIKVEITESGVYDNRQQKGDFDITLRGGSTNADPSIALKPDYYCEDSAERFRNFAGYCSEKGDELFDRLETEPDADKRMAIFKELARTLYDDLVEIPLGFTGNRFFAWLDPQVQDFVPTDGGGYTTRSAGLKKTWLKK